MENVSRASTANCTTLRRFVAGSLGHITAVSCAEWHSVGRRRETVSMIITKKLFAKKCKEISTYLQLDCIGEKSNLISEDGLTLVC